MSQKRGEKKEKRHRRYRISLLLKYSGCWVKTGSKAVCQTLIDAVQALTSAAEVVIYPNQTYLDLHQT